MIALLKRMKDFRLTWTVLQDADRIGYLKDAREAVQAVRCGNSPSPGKEETSEDIVVKAEDFLEDQIVKLPSGEWAFVAAPCDSNPR